MTDGFATKSNPTSDRKGAVGRLFVLELSGGRIHSTESGRFGPQGHRHRLSLSRWHRGRCRSRPHLLDQHGVPSLNDGSIERADIDGGNRKVIVPQGVTFSPKQVPPREAHRQTLLVRPRGNAV